MLSDAGKVLNNSWVLHQPPGATWSTSDPTSASSPSLSGSSTSSHTPATSSRTEFEDLSLLQYLARGLTPPVSQAMVDNAKAAAKSIKKNSTSALR